jgi:hypothetical protein
MYAVWSPKLNVRFIFEDAKSANQARMAYRRQLKKLNICTDEMKQYMSGIKVFPIKDNVYNIHISIK